MFVKKLTNILRLNNIVNRKIKSIRQKNEITHLNLPIHLLNVYENENIMKT